ncbi:MAG: PA2779 family protein [Pseudomonadota bacterium]|nr:PA2779 family protein [Pseudomonadota bacterium]
MFRRYVVTPVLIGAMAFSFSGPAMSGVITTQQALSADIRAAKETQVRSAFAREDVRQAMQRMGVNPADADGRIASLSDAELIHLQGQLDSLPAGGDALGVIAVVFVVFLILELLGITNMSNRI